jgi:ABC-type uncharacterized transport system ATPase subunit
MTFDSLPQGIEREIAALPVLRVHVENSTIEAAIKASEGTVLDFVTALARNRRVLRLEVSGASLEDVFIELTGEEAVA